MQKSNSLISPILKWVGGKRQLLDAITPQIPKYSTYYEPFVGGGAVLFHLQPKKAVINDSNTELINVYTVIKNEPDALVKMLKIHSKNNSKEYFYHIRAKDRQALTYADMSAVEKAARILYLNKTCYNGLFRVNNSGQFNTPWGRYKNPNIVNEPTIYALHDFFHANQITIKSGDYRQALRGIRKGAFVYFDPPYMPISESSYFTGYTPSGFTETAQIALKQECDRLTGKGVKFLLSNSRCDFIEKLYSGYHIETVPAKRFINAVAEKRGAIDEVLIRNYELD